MEYRLIRHIMRGSFIVAGSDGRVSGTLDAAACLTVEGTPRPGWWRVPRTEYNTALWEHPLWTIAARHVAPSAYGAAGDGSQSAMVGEAGPGFGEYPSRGAEAGPTVSTSSPEMNASP